VVIGAALTINAEATFTLAAITSMIIDRRVPPLFFFISNSISLSDLKNLPRQF
jgi:hypothetical protein